MSRDSDPTTRKDQIDTGNRRNNNIRVSEMDYFLDFIAIYWLNLGPVDRPIRKWAKDILSCQQFNKLINSHSNSDLFAQCHQVPIDFSLTKIWLNYNPFSSVTSADLNLINTHALSLAQFLFDKQPVADKHPKLSRQPSSNKKNPTTPPLDDTLPSCRCPSAFSNTLWLIWASSNFLHSGSWTHHRTLTFCNNSSTSYSDFISSLPDFIISHPLVRDFTYIDY
ncbi:hypothetical protein C1645_822864 [Glomus cerebriforme]|uniref:Uncharacterized protein n=1 Tax=Glomus cerebriforme TaxID=658196 RepID=A0A397SXC0_9GLOM|nr:hypothetical protein C1645_822864 [Glomus cerebriforme]